MAAFDIRSGPLYEAELERIHIEGSALSALFFFNVGARHACRTAQQEMLDMQKTRVSARLEVHETACNVQHQGIPRPQGASFRLLHHQNTPPLLESIMYRSCASKVVAEEKGRPRIRSKPPLPHLVLPVLETIHPSICHGSLRVVSQGHTRLSSRGRSGNRREPQRSAWRCRPGRSRRGGR